MTTEIELFDWVSPTDDNFRNRRGLVLAILRSYGVCLVWLPGHRSKLGFGSLDAIYGYEFGRGERDDLRYFYISNLVPWREEAA